MSAPRAVSAPDVTVVVPYYDAQPRLDLVLAALELSTHPRGRLEVVVADDGSPQPPTLGERPYATRLVRQDDHGFRAAAARNLGAAAGSGQVLCFLDGDTVPEPAYVERMAHRVATTGALVVGRRRHADLDGWTPDDVRMWLTRSRGAPAPRELPEPAWLAEGYARTDDLAQADDGSYRFVISAVLGLPRELFDRVGGFEPGFTVYGGEDWELANRCWLAGADLAHERTAVAWHDGPDLAGRDADTRAAKNAETLALAQYVTDPAARARGLVWRQPDVVVRLDDRGHSDEAVVLAAASLLRETDAGLWLAGGHAARDAGPLAQDPRVHVGDPDPDLLRRCRYQVDVTAPVLLRGTTLREVCERAPVAVRPAVVARRTRDLNRGDTRAPADADVVADPIGEVDLEGELGRGARDAGCVANW